MTAEDQNKVNVQEIVTEVKDAISNLQTVNDERAKEIQKNGKDIEELAMEQKKSKRTAKTSKNLLWNKRN